MPKITSLTEDEMRGLRKWVRFLTGARKTLNESHARHGLNISDERWEYLKSLAVTFTEK